MGKYTVTIQEPEGKREVKEVIEETKDAPLVGAGMRSGGRKRFSRKRRGFSRKRRGRGLASGGMRRRISRKRRGYGLNSGGRYKVGRYKRGGVFVRAHMRRRARR